MLRNGGRLEGLAFTKGDEDVRAVAVNYESRFPEGIIRDRVWQVFDLRCECSCMRVTESLQWLHTRQL